MSQSVLEFSQRHISLQKGILASENREIANPLKVTLQKPKRKTDLDESLSGKMCCNLRGDSTLRRQEQERSLAGWGRVSTAFSVSPQTACGSRTASPRALPDCPRALRACAAAPSRAHAPASGGRKKPASASQQLFGAHSAGRRLCIAGSSGVSVWEICLPPSYPVVESVPSLRTK